MTPPEDQRGIERTIVSFEQDEHGDWLARLDCGHTQHVRNQPPWMNREWVTTKEGRASREGSKLQCAKCPFEGSPSRA